MEQLNILQIIDKEINSLNNEIEKIEIEITSEFNKSGMAGLEKINKLNYRREILQMQVNKLYEILGKCKIKE